MEGLLSVFRSRKFWASIIALLVSIGILQLGEVQEADLVSAILTIATTVSYVISVAVEDAGRHQGGITVIQPERVTNTAMEQTITQEK